MPCKPPWVSPAGVVRSGTGVTDRVEKWIKNFDVPTSRSSFNGTKAIKEGDPLAGGPGLRRRDHQSPRPIAPEVRLLCEGRGQGIAPGGSQAPGHWNCTGSGMACSSWLASRTWTIPRSSPARSSPSPSSLPGRPSADDRDDSLRRRSALVGLRLARPAIRRSSQSRASFLLWTIRSSWASRTCSRMVLICGPGQAVPGEVVAVQQGRGVDRPGGLLAEVGLAIVDVRRRRRSRPGRRPGGGRATRRSRARRGFA